MNDFSELEKELAEVVSSLDHFRWLEMGENKQNIIKTMGENKQNGQEIGGLVMNEKETEVTIKFRIPSELLAEIPNKNDPVVVSSLATKLELNPNIKYKPIRTGKCLHCGKEFELGRADQKFCSVNCRVYYNRRNKNT